VFKAVRITGWMVSEFQICHTVDLLKPLKPLKAAFWQWHLCDPKQHCVRKEPRFSHIRWRLGNWNPSQSCIANH